MDKYDIENQEEYVKKGFVDKVKETAAKVPFVADAVSLYFCALDEKTPLLARITAFGALAYFILPIDAIPDLVPIAGYTDDAGAIAAALIALTPYISDEHRQKAKDWLNGIKS
ncbi:hypothetical protein CLHUN_08390 [Ruminiclostridium hungatei]|uniref:DUF1232 domain-containing protein n=1 Tax=Ruminiclostridium hungatei TaxID=48256 RepID=A0A1V4SNK1_RUMHU|nr:YkvA family protein [Ruminiclostridium hungatei]OPX45469.1 hypothetical protein CLHUN_08390 [Ruminiclostridium hungatei]